MSTAQYEFEVKAKGRAVIPAGLRSACGFEPGTMLHARPLGPGQAVVETSEAILERIWSANTSPEADTGGVEDLAAWRANEVLGSNASPDAEAGSPEPLTDAGRATLAALGLD